MSQAPLDLVLSKFPDAKPRADGQYMALCPSHEDNHPTLSIGQGDNGGAVLKCFAGCDNTAIVQAVGLTLADLMPPKEQSAPTGKWEMVPGSMKPADFVYYDYADAHGNALYQSVRKPFLEKNATTGETRPAKTFFQRRKARHGEESKNGFVSDMKGVEYVLYRLPSVLKAAQDRRAVYIVEGEKDADNLAALHITATTNIGGAGKWRPEYTESLRGAHVVILPDADKPGRDHASNVAANVQSVAASVRIVELPGLKSKQDISDWLQKPGNDAAALRELAKAAPLWKPVGALATALQSTTENSDGEPFHTTDTGNGKRLAKRHGRDLRYCPEWGKWIVWNGKIWEPDPASLLVMARAKETALSIYAEAAGEAQTDLRKELATHARRTEGAERLNAMIQLARSEAGIPVRVKELDTHRWLLSCDNGTLDLRNGELLPHSQADLITKKTGCAYLSDAPAPRWEAFLNQILPDADVRAFFQRAIGYALTGDVSEQCLFFLYGSGSNGKSTALGTLMAMMGDYALQAAPDLLVSKEKNSGPNNEIADLQGARFVATIEVEDGQRMAEGLVKQITGGDKIKARFMRQDYFEFDPTHKILLAANHQPVIRGQDFAIWRRIKVLPFTVQIADKAKDPTMPDKLREELPGILAWAVRGCLEWLKSGLREPDAVKAATDAYRGEMDVLRDFVADCCILRPSLSITSATLYKAYTAWCDENGVHPLGSKNFTTRIKEQNGVQASAKVRDARGFLGIALRSDREPPEDFKMNGDTSDTSDTENRINNLKKKSRMEIGEIVSEVSEVCKINRPEKLIAELRAEFENPQSIVDFWRGRVVLFKTDTQRIRLYWPDAPDRDNDFGGWSVAPEPVTIAMGDLDARRKRHADRMAQTVEVEI